MFETGVAKRASSHIDRIEHVVVRMGHDDWRTWCGGGPAVEDQVSVTRRRCPRCLALARHDLVELQVADDEASEFDWYLGRRPRLASQ